MTSPFPEDVSRIPDEEWTTRPLAELALKYDTVENHGWYENLEHTVSQLVDFARPDMLWIDYSGGTGILEDRLLDRAPDLPVGICVVDSSAKFLRLALEKFRDDERFAFRRIRYLKEKKRLELLDEVLDPPLVERGLDAIISTNAIHLYYDLSDTLKAWKRVLRPSGRVFVQSGNIRNPEAPADSWIIDETVELLQQEVKRLVESEDRYQPYREALDDTERMKRYATYRQKIFLPTRPLDHYLSALREAGFSIESVETRLVRADVSEWYDFLSVYHEGVLGWVGGIERIEGEPPRPVAVRHRRELMRRGLSNLFGEATGFDCCWTYIVATD